MCRCCCRRPRRPQNVLPRLAAKLDTSMISEITKVVSVDTFERPVYAGNVIATVQSSDPVKVITVRTTAFEAAGAEGGSAETVSLDGAFCGSVDNPAAAVPRLPAAAVGPPTHH